MYMSLLKCIALVIWPFFSNQWNMYKDTDKVASMSCGHISGSDNNTHVYVVQNVWTSKEVLIYKSHVLVLQSTINHHIDLSTQHV